MRRVYTLAILTSLNFTLALPDVAQAQSADSAAAESLFQEGKALLQQNEFAKACPKLAESYRLDPATGTLLALAMCHEGEGKLASAWAEYTEVSVRSKREHRDDRERAARDKAEALRSKLSYLTIEVSPGARSTSGLEVKRDGVVVGQGAWGSATPVDAGEHVVEVSAPGKQPWTQKITVGGQAARESVVVPALPNAAKGGAGTVTGSASGSVQGPGGGLTGLQIAGLGVGGLGVVGLGIGGFFGLQAMSKKSDSEKGGACDSNNVCSDGDALAARKDAVSAGNVATVAFIAGGVLAVGGTAMFFLGKPSKKETVARVSAAPYALPGGGGLWMTGRF